MKIEGKTFLVTGGSSGLGAASARMLACAGARVVLADLDSSSGESIARELGEAVRFIQTDVTDATRTRQAIDLAVRVFGELNGAINCAGIAPGERVLGKAGPHSLDTFNRVITINLVGTFNVIRLAAEAIAKTNPDSDGERGVIINTSSVAAFDGQIGQAAYSASKGGVAAMTLPIARELARFGIRVMTIAPGIFNTPTIAGMTQEVRNSLGGQAPFPPRLGKPEEFASLVRHIIENQMLNGEVIRLDGAVRMTAK